MARSVDVVNKSSQAKGYDMVARTRETHPKPSLAQGRVVTGMAGDVNAASGSPGAALGTGSNPDRYTPGIEAV
jgi:hypothetical protein